MSPNACVGIEVNTAVREFDDYTDDRILSRQQGNALK
jgi:hypothetical protein